MTNDAILKKYKGDKVSIAYEKTAIILTPKVEFSGDGWFTVEYKKKSMNMQTERLKYYSYDKAREMFKLGIKFPSITTGTVVNLSSKFIEVQIYDNVNNDTYEVAIPIKEITGIKHLSYDEDDV